MRCDMSAFDQAFEIVVGHEGGYSNNSSDPGGETMYGISKRSYPDIVISTLTLDQAKAIYERDYWNKAGCDLCDPGLALVLFDAAVNNGVGQAARIHFMAGLSTWSTFGRGWSRRLAHLPYQAAGMTDNNTPAVTEQPPAG